MESNNRTGQGTTVINNDIGFVKQGNGLGTAGFVLAIIGVFLSWVPFIGQIIWLLGAVFSVVGLFKPNKGLAIAGTVISFIGLIIIMSLLGGLALLM